jgi:CheY-like chemotaxis protein
MRPKLLLADDSVTIQRVIELTFAEEDVQVLTAGDGEQAIARVQADRPDIVLADIGMPKRSGYDVAAFVKGQPELAHIPVLLLTGAFEPVDEGRAQAVGCDGVLVKPFEPQHVIARVRELLRGRQGSTIAGGTVTRAVADIPRPIERLAPRPADLPARHESPRAGGGALERVPGRDFGVVASPESARPANDASLDDYFDRLDAAFANISSAAPERAAEPGERESLVHEPEVMPPHQGPVLEEDLDWFDSPSQPSAASSQPVSASLPAAPAEPASPSAPVPADVPTTFASPPSAFGGAASSALDTPVVPGLEGLPSSLARPQGPPVEPAELPSTITPAPARADAAPPAAPAPARVSAPAAAAITVADAFSALLAVEEGEPGAAPVRLATIVQAAPQMTDDMVDEIARRVMERLGPDAVRDVVSRVAERLVREEIARIRKREI